MKELVFALDVTEKNKALNLGEEVAQYIDKIKVNYPLVLSSGIKIIKELSNVKPVIADFKIADIPYTSSLIADIAFENGASAVIVHGFSGSDTIKAVLEVAERYGGEVYVVTELSSKGGEEFMAKHSYEIIKLATSLGCHGLIAPATRIERLARVKEIAQNMKVLAPGVGVQGGSLEVLRYADGIIVGRSIYMAESPRRAAEEIRRGMDGY